MKFRSTAGMVMCGAMALVGALRAEATWSIVLADTETKEVAAGTVTCLNDLDLLARVPAVVVGKGAGCVQSLGDPDGSRRVVMFDGFQFEEPLGQIFAELETIAGHEQRQYGLVNVAGEAITFSGSENGAWAGGVTGTQGTLVYAIQGNVLAGACVVDAIEQAVLNTDSDMAGKLMAGMVAARDTGGDGRCSCDPNEPEACGCPVPVFDKPGHIGGVVVARRGDSNDGNCDADGCADGDYFLRLNVAFEADEDPDPVDQLLEQFRAWRAARVGYPDAVQSVVTIDDEVLPATGGVQTVMRISLRDWRGESVTAAVQGPVVVHDNPSALNSVIGARQHQGGGQYRVPLTGRTIVGLDRFRISVFSDLGEIRLMPSPELRYVDPATDDCNANGIADGLDLAAGTSQDLNSNGRPDTCEPDCNANGVADALDIAAGTASDCNANFVPDGCESGADCDDNGIADICDIALGAASDCNANDIPDGCEDPADCNANQTLDLCERFAGTDTDCNANGVLDGCDISAGTDNDCNGDGLPDACNLVANAHDCCTTDHGAGCSDATIESCVCAVDPYCCDVAWDAFCIEGAAVSTCGVCTGDSDCNINGLPDACDAADLILTQPADVLGCAGGMVMLTLDAADDASVHWTKEGLPLVNGNGVSGATTETLTIVGVVGADAGTYGCRVTDGCVEGESVPIQLTVIDAPATVTGQPTVELGRCVGATASFSVTASGTLLGYAWQRDGEPLADDGRISGSATSSLSISDLSLADMAAYTCVVSDPCGNEDESQAGVLVVGTPVFGLIPQSTCVELDGTVVLTGEATSAADQVGYRWNKDGAPLMEGGGVSGVFSDRLTITGVLASDAGQYSLTAFSLPSPICLSESPAAMVTVGGCPTCATPGDFDEDGDRDLADFHVFAQCIGADVVIAPECACANVADEDAVIDLFDWAALELLFTGP